MDLTVTDHQNCKKELQIKIPSETVLARTEALITDMARTVNIAGFRPGRVPRSVIKSRFRKELRDQVVRDLLPELLADAIEEADLKVVGSPSLEQIDFGNDESLSVTLSVEVAPEITLAGYKNLQLKKQLPKVTDELVDKEVERLRREHAELAPVEDRPAQFGDIITVDVEGMNDSGKGEPIKNNEVEIELSDSTMGGFRDALIGAKPGEERTFSIDYPAGYNTKRLAGQRVNYTAKVTALRVRELPEIDDELAQAVDAEHRTVADLRQALRAKLQERANQIGDERVRTEAMEALVDANQFDVPENAVQSQISSRLESLLRAMDARGMDLGNKQIDWSGLREAQRGRAEREVRGSYVLAKIAEDEGIEVTEEELEKHLEGMAGGVGLEPAALKARLTKENALDSMKFQLRNRKALELVISSADINIEEVEALNGGDEPGDAGSDKEPE